MGSVVRAKTPIAEKAIAKTAMILPERDRSSFEFIL